jgi:Bifunctional DNA primase/polymerase, N-terminal/AAA domain
VSGRATFAKSKLEWALEHAARDIPVFPLVPLAVDGACACPKGDGCGSPGKHPLVSTGFKSATTHRAQIRRWWKKWPEANIGGATGGRWVVLDIDPRNGGDSSLAEFEDRYGGLPRSATVKTGLFNDRRGEHFWFESNGDRIASGERLPGVEIKADGGYVVLPGSSHASGVVYGWAAEPRFESMPPQLARLVRPRARPEAAAERTLTGLPLGQRTLDALTDGLPIEEGKNHRDVAVGIARNLVESGCPEPLVLFVMARILEHPASTLDSARPWTSNDVEAIVSSVVRDAAPDSVLSSATRSAARSPENVLAASRVDLVALLKDGIPEREYVPGCAPWLLAGKRYLIPAPAGTGKSLFGLIVATAVVRAGGTVVILDVENGSEEYARRLDDVLAAVGDDALVNACAERLHYHAWPALSMRWSAVDWAAAVGAVDLVIFDSSRLVLTPAGLNENDSGDYATFVNALLMPLSKAGITTMVLDNTGHGDGEQARGTTAKSDLNEVVYSIGAKTTLDRAVTSDLRLKRKRTRFAGVPDVLSVAVGGGVYGPVTVVDEPQATSASRAFDRMERARAAVLIEVRTRPGATARDLRRIAGVGPADVKDATASLLEEGRLRFELGPHGSRRHFVVSKNERERERV